VATSLKNLSSYNPEEIPSGRNKKIGIVCSEWNEPITGSLFKAACDTLLEHGVSEDDIIVSYVPGTYELPYGAHNLLEKNRDLNAVITIGCVIQGETPHFDFICQAAAMGIMEVGLKFNKPSIFGVLTTNTLEQAQARSGGKHGNKGVEAAVTALKLI
jgi:6,7-dimethyl-8-ribityllumazine synthase